MYVRSRRTIGRATMNARVHVYGKETVSLEKAEEREEKRKGNIFDRKALVDISCVA